VRRKSRPGPLHPRPVFRPTSDTRADEQRPSEEAHSPVSHLDRLAAELTQSGWAVSRRYNAPLPQLHVFAAAVPNLGESISTVPTPTSGEHWYCSSTGFLLALCGYPRRAAEAVAALLIPVVNAALARRNVRQPPPSPITWWGEQTRQWWALVQCGSSCRLVAASDRQELARSSHAPAYSPAWPEVSLGLPATRHPHGAATVNHDTYPHPIEHAAS
jgi:hypothetical protein